MFHGYIIGMGGGGGKLVRLSKKSFSTHYLQNQKMDSGQTWYII